MFGIAQARRRTAIAGLIIVASACMYSVARPSVAHAAGLSTAHWLSRGGGQVSSPRTAAQAAAPAPATQTLPVSTFGDMVVDAAHSHVFVSAPGSNEILVFDY